MLQAVNRQEMCVLSAFFRRYNFLNVHQYGRYKVLEQFLNVHHFESIVSKFEVNQSKTNGDTAF